MANPPVLLYPTSENLVFEVFLGDNFVDNVFPNLSSKDQSERTIHVLNLQPSQLISWLCYIKSNFAIQIKARFTALDFLEKLASSTPLPLSSDGSASSSSHFASSIKEADPSQTRSMTVIWQSYAFTRAFTIGIQIDIEVGQAVPSSTAQPPALDIPYHLRVSFEEKTKPRKRRDHGRKRRNQYFRRCLISDELFGSSAESGEQSFLDLVHTATSTR